MSALKAFLQPAVAESAKEILISERFLDESGNPVMMKIKSITQAENKAIIEQSTRPKSDKGRTYESFNNDEYRARLIVACTVVPDFAQKEMCDAYGVIAPEDVPGKMLLAGEFARLSSAIMEINGYKEIGELNEEAKNS
jgi:hypothetical protein